MDRLSELPLSLILQILSLLPMRDVVSTTVLSKGWNNLWTTVPCLNFYENIKNDEDVEKVRKFIDRALLLKWNGSKILKFELNINPYYTSLAGDIDGWVHFAIGNEVEELNLDSMYDGDDIYWDDSPEGMKDVYVAPQLLNSCSWIKKLSLVGCIVRIPGIPTWNQLKSLRIDGFRFGEDLINRILLGSPRLEDFELCLLLNYEYLNIESTSLKKLKINKYLIFDENNDEITLDGGLRICCPKLETMELSGVFYSEYILTDVSSLTDATLGFHDEIYHDIPGNELVRETLRQILPAIQYVETLCLSFQTAQELGASHKKATLSPLPNVKFLKLTSTDNEFGEVQIRDTMSLLGIFPNLKMLVIAAKMPGFWKPPMFNLEFVTSLPKSFLMKLEIVQITSCLTKSSIFPIIEFLLKYARRLKKLVIQPECGKTYSQETLSRASKELLSMPRSSPTGKVIFSTNRS